MLNTMEEAMFYIILCAFIKYDFIPVLDYVFFP